MIETRRHPRQTTPLKMIAFRQIAGHGFGDLLDVSQGGVKMRTVDRVDVGAIDLTFKLPPAHEPLAATGTVVWIKERHDLYYDVGIEFNAPNERIIKVIRLFMGGGIGV